MNNKLNNARRLFERCDAHVFPKGRKGHVVGKLTDCPCEIVPRYIERTPDGFIWRRVAVHGQLKG